MCNGKNLQFNDICALCGTNATYEESESDIVSPRTVNDDDTEEMSQEDLAALLGESPDESRQKAYQREFSKPIAVPISTSTAQVNKPAPPPPRMQPPPPRNSVKYEKLKKGDDSSV
eukprot:UN27996